MKSILGPGLCFLALASCAHGGSSSDAENVASSLAPYLRHGAEVAALIEHARTTPHMTSEGPVVSASVALAVRTDGAFALKGRTPLSFRVAGLSGAPRVEGRHVALGDAASSALVFDHGAGVEILHRLERRVAVAYALELPSGHSLGSGGDTIEVVDGEGVPRVRLTADAAWDRDGKRVPVRLAIVDRATITVNVPDDAAYPVVIDPTWSATTSPTRLRSGHVATLMASGDVLLTGGGSSTAEVFDYVSGRFRAVSAMARSRSGHAAVTLESGKVLVIGGREGSTKFSSTELYDPATGAFTAGPSSTASGSMTALRLRDGKVVATSTEASSSTLDLYNPSTNTWSSITKATTAAGNLVPLANGDVLIMGQGSAELYHPSTSTFDALSAPGELTPYLLAAPLTDGRALVYGFTEVSMSLGGSTSYTKRTWIFDSVTKAFTDGPVVESPNLAPIGTALPSGKVLFIGSTMQVFDPTTNAWSSSTATIANHRGGTVTVLPSGDVLVAGGDAGTAALYVATDVAGPGTFKVATQSVGRVGARATRLLDGRVLLAGGGMPVGTTASGATTAEVFNPTTGAWASPFTLQASRVAHAQVLLPSGKVLIVGGQGSSTAEIFDPATTTSTPTGSLPAVREGASATLLPSGKVLVAGGSSLSTAELFDPATGMFSAVASPMSAAHSHHGAVLLPSGRVLIIDRASSEYFDPATSTFSAGPGLSASRDGRSATLLATGDVLVVGGNKLPQERYSAATASFGLSGSLDSNITSFGAAALPFGRVLVAGGLMNVNRDSSPFAWIYDPRGDGGNGVFEKTTNLPDARRETTLTPLTTGGVLIAGGDGCANGCFAAASRESMVFEPLGPALADRPTITTVPTSITPGTAFTIAGTKFVGDRDVSARSSGRVPVFSFVPASGQGIVRVAVDSFTDTTASLRVPATAFRGNGFLQVSVAGVAGPGKLLTLGAATDGTTCSVASDCSSGFCVDGVCCDSKCDGVCQACTASRKGSGTDGVCGAIPPAKDSKDACALFQGAACSNDAECASGVCADGVCCDARCTGQCESCAVPGSVGTCTPAIGAPLAGKAACDAGSDSCGARVCDGLDRASCAGYAPTTKSCRIAGCVDGIETLPASCDGKGACPAATTKTCEPFVCGDGVCLTRCTADSECKDGYRCAAGKCVTGAYCANERTLRNPGTADADCSPYLCEGTACKTSCASSLECAGGYVCDGGKCITPTTGADAGAEDGGGCAVAAPGRTSGSAALLLLALGLLRRFREPRARASGSG